MTSVACRVCRASLSAFLGLTALACGGTGSNADRKAAAAAAGESPPVFNDPGSLMTYSCEADQPSSDITTLPLEDWESSAGPGWYTNNDKCESCQDAMNGINDAAPEKGVILDEPGLAAALADLAKCRPGCLASQIPSYFNKPVPSEKIPNGRCLSTYAFHVISGPFTKWGGQLGHTFNPPKCVTGDCPPESDAVPGGPYDGIAFWARVAPGSGTNMRIQVGESHTDVKYPLIGPDGPPCVDNVGTQMPNDTTQGCDTFGTFIILNSDWQFFTLPFAEMRQAGWGKRAPFFDIQHISNLTFFYAQGVWDIWIDDISFYRRSAQ